MKKIIAIIILLLVVFLDSNIHCQNNWKYPIIPGSKEWRQLKSEKQIIEVQQIPGDVLKKMTTMEVYQAWLDLPGRMEILAFNTLQEGFDKVRKRFNVLDELLSRKDVATVILSRFFTSTITDLQNELDSNKKGKFITDFGLTEFLLSQPEVMSKMNSYQKKLLFGKIKDELRRKSNLSGRDYDFFWISSGLVLGCRLLEKENLQFQNNAKSHADIKEPLKRGEITSRNEFEKLKQAITENDI